jgi:multidrug efflux pump subunit AcrA (membrane-fusion protein)
LAALPAGAVGPKAGRVVLEVRGYIVPARQVLVSPKVAGQVVELPIEEGRVVKAGDVLAKLDPAEYEAALHLARAEALAARARYEKARATKTDVPIYEAELAAAEARVKIAQQRLNGTVVRAPLSGTVLTKKVEVGALVNPQAFSIAAAVCELADLGDLEVDVPIMERDLGRVLKGQRCLIQPLFPQAEYKGHVVRVLPVLDRAKATASVRVRIEIPKGDDRLRPEMSAVVKFLSAN